MALNAEQLYDKALFLGSDVEDNFYDLAKTLRRLREQDPDLYAKALLKAGVGKRKAYYLMGIAEQFGDIQIPKARLRAIGWTKMMVIGPYVNPHNAEELLTLAEQVSTAQLKSYVTGNDPATNSHCVLMYFSPEQYTVFERHLVEHGAMRSGRGLVDKESALIKALGKPKALADPHKALPSPPKALPAPKSSKAK